MENNITSLGLSQPFAAPRGNGTESANQPRSAVQELLAPEQAGQVQLNQDIPQTSQIPEVENQLETRTNQTNNAEQATDQAAQQQQIESFLAEQTGQDEENFRGIDVQSALVLQESLRNRPETNLPQTESFAAANNPANDSDIPADANEQQSQDIQQRLQSRLAEQIPNDPGTEFPQLIETIA